MATAKMRLTFGLTSGLVLMTAAFVGCNRDHDPTAHHAQIKQERMMANQPVAELTKDGKLPSSGSGQAVARSGNAKYDSFCITCHGPDGKAATAAAMAMSPRPRDFSDVKWQESVDDARIAKVIKEGGASVGLSASMAPWGSALSDQDIDSLVKLIRSFKGK